VELVINITAVLLKRYVFYVDGIVFAVMLSPGDR